MLQPVDPSESDLSCRDYYSQVMRDAGNCLVNSGPAIMALSSTGLGWVLLTLLYTMVLIFRVYADLARYRYQQHRTANIQVRLVAAARAWSQTIMVLCIVFYWFVHMHSCASYIMTAYGFAPWMVRKEGGQGGGNMTWEAFVGPAGAQTWWQPPPKVQSLAPFTLDSPHLKCVSCPPYSNSCPTHTAAVLHRVPSALRHHVLPARAQRGRALHPPHLAPGGRLDRGRWGGTNWRGVC